MAARILIAEDHPDSLLLMCYLLEAHGYAALTATDGEIALALTRKHRPDLIVCDLQMPRLDGYEVARQLKLDPELKHIPLIAVTAYAMLGDREKVLAAGFDGYFSKPIDTDRFVSELELHLHPALRARPRRGVYEGR